jgi:hypothetical protein
MMASFLGEVCRVKHVPQGYQPPEFTAAVHPTTCVVIEEKFVLQNEETVVPVAADVAPRLDPEEPLPLLSFFKRPLPPGHQNL